MTSLAGWFLVARPTLQDPFFRRSVVLMLRHGPDGAFGLVLNRPERTKDLPFAVYRGGPCKFQGLILLHGQDEWVEPGERDACEVCPGVFLGNAECLQRVTDPDPGAPNRFRVFAGYSGWAPGQLEAELAEGSWHVVKASSAPVFDVESDEAWLRLAPASIPEPSLN